MHDDALLVFPGVSYMFLLAALASSATLVRSLTTNRTVDDEHGDEESGVKPSYSSSSNAWSQGAQCSGCGVNLGNIDLTQVHDRTWHDATYRPGDGPLSLTVTFTGTAVYVYNIIANNLLPTITYTNVSFYLDGEDVGTYNHAPDDSSTLEYNVLVFHRSSLANAPHTLVMGVSGDDISLVLFDYLLYTVEDSSIVVSSSTKSAGATPAPPAQTSHTPSTSLASSGMITSSSPPSTTAGENPGPTPSGSGDVSATLFSEDTISHSTTNTLPTLSASSSTAVAIPTSAAARTGSTPSPGTIAGVTLGCIGLMTLVCIVIWLCRRLRKQSMQSVGPSSLRGLRNIDFDGLADVPLDPGRPVGVYPRSGRFRPTLWTLPLETIGSSGAFATLGASVYELDSERTLVMRDSTSVGRRKKAPRG